ncbi:hypothetical protein F0L68_39205 [Solihabitans fulvus]|uniref:DUF6801 domain-containing protein n=1 Tax=Solihabitans fulvus TaxID=1892852 RepID=A0A5B2WDL5_9PSEU|nr:DUF6801 domain-containing protein [Solihabitans fulvus]KAA2250173.1 hypothetical protein F0L68_39205 [Solihabitans fulvus]
MAKRTWWRQWGIVAGGVLVAALAVVPTAGAAPVSPAVPAGAEIGQVNFPFSCTMPIIGTQTVNVGLSGTLTSQLGSGQQFYLSDGAGTLTIPANVVNLIAALGADSMSGTVNTLQITATGATPASLDAANGTPIVIPSTKLVADQPVVLPLPADGLLTVGPYTAGTSGIANLGVGGSTATINLADASGNPVLYPLDVTCDAPNPTVSLAAVNIGGPAGLPPAQPSTGARAVFGDIPLGSLTGSVNLPLSCTVSGLGSQDISGTLTGTFARVVPGGSQFSITGGGGSLNYSASAVNAILAQYPTATTASGSLTDFEVQADNATPASVNAASPAIAVGQTALTAGQAASVPIPSGTDTLTIGPFTAGPSGGQVTLSAGSSGGTITVQDAGGTTLGSAQISCATPNPRVALSQISIS